MSIKRKALTTAALTTVVIGGVSAAGAFSASAATPATAPRLEIFSAEFGTAASPNFIETVSHGIAKAGQPTVLNPVDDSNPRQYLTGYHPGLVSDFYKAGLVSADVNKHYGTLHAVEVEYAPNGVASHLCVGLPTATAHQNEGLTLEKCDTPTTVWIIDTADSPKTEAQGYFPIVNGTTTDYTHPYAMTYYGNPSHKGNADKPIRIAHLLDNPTDTHNNQLWGVVKK